MLVDGVAIAEILDDDGAGSGLDADRLDGIDSSSFSLTSHWHSSLNAADGNPTNALFIDAGGDVGIGTTSPSYLLTVKGVNRSTAAYISNDGTYIGETYGLNVSTFDGTTGGSNARYGIKAVTANDFVSYGASLTSNGSGEAYSYGLHSIGRNTFAGGTDGQAYGGYFVADNDRSGGESYGLYSEATGANGRRYGLYNKVTMSGAGAYANYGVYSEVANTSDGWAYGYRADVSHGGPSGDSIGF